MSIRYHVTGGTDVSKLLVLCTKAPETSLVFFPTKWCIHISPWVNVIYKHLPLNVIKNKLNWFKIKFRNINLNNNFYYKYALIFETCLQKNTQKIEQITTRNTNTKQYCVHLYFLFHFKNNGFWYHLNYRRWSVVPLFMNVSTGMLICESE